MHTTKLTKIVATIGPATETEEKIEKLLQAGVNVLRFNTKHNTPLWHHEHIKLAQRVADRLGVTIGILLDLQGPEVRLETRDKQDIPLVEGQELTIGLSFVDGIDVIMPHAQVFELLKPGGELLIDDGFVETSVISVTEDRVVVKVIHGNVAKHRKGVNLPGIDIDFPSLIDNDIKQLDANSRNKVDYIGLSFVRSAHDIELLRAEMLKREMNAMIVAKIESQPALDRLDEIIHSSDVVMVARGDLGVEVPFEQLAFWQRTVIDKCRLANKPVITATQMLESMIVNPRPTRAEVTDVAHAVFEGTDAVMLSGETAGGKYPVRTVETMAKIVKWNESKQTVHHIHFDDLDATATIAEAVAAIVTSKVQPKISSVLVFTETGFTARSLAKHRLPIPIIAVAEKRKVAESLTVSYGIYPVIMDLPQGTFGTVEHLLKELVTKEILHMGETIIVVHGQHWQKAGTTNALAIVKL